MKLTGLGRMLGRRSPVRVSRRVRVRVCVRRSGSRHCRKTLNLGRRQQGRPRRRGRRVRGARRRDRGRPRGLRQLRHFPVWTLRRDFEGGPGAGLVLCLSPPQRRLQGHDPLSLGGQATLVATALPVLAVPLVALQRYLEAVVPASGAVRRRARAGRGASRGATLPPPSAPRPSRRCHPSFSACRVHVPEDGPATPGRTARPRSRRHFR